MNNSAALEVDPSDVDLLAVSTPILPSDQHASSGSDVGPADIDLLVEMLREASQSRDAKQVLASFARRLWVINPIDGTGGGGAGVHGPCSVARV